MVLIPLRDVKSSSYDMILLVGTAESHYVSKMAHSVYESPRPCSNASADEDKRRALTPR